MQGQVQRRAAATPSQTAWGTMRTTSHILAAALLAMAFTASATTGDEDDIDSLWDESGAEDGSRDGDSYQCTPRSPNPLSGG